jgi:hypothetical protein
MNRNFFFFILLLQCLTTNTSEAFSPQTSTWELPIPKNLIHDPSPYILPSDNALKPILDSLFPSQEIINNEKTFAKAGFITLVEKKSSGIRIAKHPKMPGFLVKLYLTSHTFHRDDMSKQNWLIQRCRGAAKFRNLIRKKHIQYFVAPEKWLYELPKKPGERSKRTFIIVETYMNIVSNEKTRKALKEKITKRHLQELVLFMKIGGAPGSGAFDLNAPYTKEGKFAFIDTEYPDRIFPAEKIKKIGRYFSGKMRDHWIHLIDKQM